MGGDFLDPQKNRCTQRGFLGVFGVSGRSAKVVTKIRGVAMSQNGQTPGKPLTLRGFVGVSVVFWAKIGPNLATLGLGGDFGPKMGFPAPFLLERKPQKQDLGPLSPKKGAGKPFFSPKSPKPHYTRPLDDFAAEKTRSRPLARLLSPPLNSSSAKQRQTRCARLSLPSLTILQRRFQMVLHATQLTAKQQHTRSARGGDFSYDTQHRLPRSARTAIHL